MASVGKPGQRCILNFLNREMREPREMKKSFSRGLRGSQFKHWAHADAVTPTFLSAGWEAFGPPVPSGDTQE